MARAKSLPERPTARRDRLVELVETAKPRGLPALLAHCEDFVRNNTAALALPLVEALGERDRAVEIARLAAHLLAEPPPGCSPKLARGLLRLVEDHGDGGIELTPSRELALAPSRLASVRKQLAKRPASSAPKPPSRASNHADEASLIAQVAEQPDDDGPRLVLADIWTSGGDVRGELIALQLAHRTGKPSPAAKQREAALLANHRPALFGPFAKHVKRTGSKFERGFLVRAVARNEWPPHPLNALLEHVDFDGNASALDVEFRSLREAWNPRYLQLAALIDRAPRLETLGFTRHLDTGELDAAFERASRSMKRVVIRTNVGALHPLAAVTRSPIATTATDLEIVASYPEETTLAMLLPLLPASCVHFVFDVISPSRMRFELVRAGRGWEVAGSIPAHEEWLLPRLETDLARAVAGLSVARARFVVADRKAIAPVQRAVAGISNATVTR